MSNDLGSSISKVLSLMGQANYREWALEIKAIAHFVNVWKAMQGTDKAISTEAVDKAALEAREEKALSLITQTVSSHLKIELDEYRVIPPSGTTPREATAAEMWTYLKTKFEKKDGVSAIIDWGYLTHTKLVDDGTLKEQLNSFQQLRSRCALNGFKYEDWQYATLLLLTLSDSYKSIKEHFLTTDNPKKLNPDDIHWGRGGIYPVGTW